MIDRTKFLVWKTNLAQSKVASFRIRCLLPALGLESKGYKSIILQKNEKINNFTKCLALIFVKTFNKHDYALALDAKANQVPIVIDLCDNIFVEGYPINNIGYFNKIADLASVIITTGSELANILKAQLPSLEVIVIPDQVEDYQLIKKIDSFQKKCRNRRFILSGIVYLDYVKLFFYIFSNRTFYAEYLLKTYSRLSKLFLFIFNYIKNVVSNKNTIFLGVNDYVTKKIIWFGNHGANHSDFGMKSLLLIKNDLEEINKSIPIELLIVSNSREKFEGLISPFQIKTKYKKWNLFDIFNDIRSADVFIMPNPKDQFSLCKSPNRALLSLSLGTPVVATSFEGLRDISDCIVKDDFLNGVRLYLTDMNRVESDLNKARIVIKLKFSSLKVVENWESLILRLDKI